MSPRSRPDDPPSPAPPCRTSSPPRRNCRRAAAGRFRRAWHAAYRSVLDGVAGSWIRELGPVRRPPEVISWPRPGSLSTRPSASSRGPLRVRRGPAPQRFAGARTQRDRTASHDWSARSSGATGAQGLACRIESSRRRMNPRLPCHERRRFLRQLECGHGPIWAIRTVVATPGPDAGPRTFVLGNARLPLPETADRPLQAELPRP